MGDTIGTLTRARRRPITGNTLVDADLYTGLEKNNPFGIGDPQSYGQLVKQVGWNLNQENNLRNIVANFRNRLGTGGGFATGGGFTPLINPATGQPAAPTTSQDQFSLLSVSKDPSGRFDQINRGLLDKAAGFKPNYSEIRGTTSDALSSLNAAQGDIDANRVDTNTLIEKFRALSPTLDAQVASQTNALDRVYNGGLKNELAANTEAARVAENTAAQRAMRQALFQNRMGSAGGAGSSYAQAQLSDALGRFGVETAARDADRRRQDTAALLRAQETNLGRTQDLATTNLLRNQIPVDARSRILDQEVNLALRRLAGAGQAASIDQLTDELSTVGRQLGLTSQALQNYLATNFFGVNKEGQDYPLYISGGGGGGRVNPYFTDPGNGFEDGGGFMRPPGPQDPTPTWVDRLRAQQGWQRDANGNYTIPGNRPNYVNYPNTGQAIADPDYIGNYNMYGDYDYSQPGPLYYPGFNDLSPTDRLNLSDYYEGNVSDTDLMDYYSGEYNW